MFSYSALSSFDCVGKWFKFDAKERQLKSAKGIDKAVKIPIIILIK